MKLPSYSEVLKMGKEALEESLVPIRTNRAKKQAELEMCDLEEKIATQESKVAELCRSKDLNFKRIIDAQDELALLLRRKEQYQEILSQMFPK